MKEKKKKKFRNKVVNINFSNKNKGKICKILLKKISYKKKIENQKVKLAKIRKG